MRHNDTMCKVDELIVRYDLSSPRDEYDTLDEYLLSRWNGCDELESVGYQTLTEWFNKQVLTQIYDEHGRDTPTFKIDSEYELLMGDHNLRRDELAADLAADRIDINDVEDELISWSTMRRHLNGCLDGQKNSEQSTSEWELESIEVARSKMVEKAQAALHSLSSKQRLPDASEAGIDVQVKLSCPKCPTRVPLEDAVERGYVCKEHFQTVPTQTENEDSPNKVDHAVLPSGVTQIMISLTDDVGYTLDLVAATGVL